MNRIIGYVCTNFNNSAFTVRAVETLIQSCGDRARIVVVDNASSESAVEELRCLEKKHTALKVFASGDNVGYFSGLNIGLSLLREWVPEVELVVVGNNDLEFPDEFADRLDGCNVVFNSYPVVSPDVVTLDGVHQNPHVVSGISKLRRCVYECYYSSYSVARCMLKIAQWTNRWTGRRDGEEWRSPRVIKEGHGSCYILGPRFFSEFGQLWAPSFLMGEESFLSMQLRHKGESVYYEPSIRVLHHYHAAMAKVPARRIWEYGRMAHKLAKRHENQLRQGGRSPRE